MHGFTSILSLNDEERQKIANGAEVRVLVHWGEASAYVQVEIGSVVTKTLHTT